jgi:hypothetical protein
VIVGGEDYYNFHIFLRMTLVIGFLSGVVQSLFGFEFGLGLALIEDAILFFLKD